MKKMVPRVKIKEDGYGWRRYYHTNFPLSGSKDVVSIAYPCSEENDKEVLQVIGKKGALLIWKTLQVPGVRGICISPYQLTVTISEVIERWDREVEPALYQAFEDIFGVDERDIFGPKRKILPREVEEE